MGGPGDAVKGPRSSMLTTRATETSTAAQHGGGAANP